MGGQRSGNDLKARSVNARRPFWIIESQIKTEEPEKQIVEWCPSGKVSGFVGNFVVALQVSLIMATTEKRGWNSIAIVPYINDHLITESSLIVKGPRWVLNQVL